MTEPEQKRKIIGEEFIRVFEEEAKKIGAVDFLAQGTIYPDVVESGLGGESAVIKSHHNVGGLPDYVDFKEIIEPLRDLFKDEVRKAVWSWEFRRNWCIVSRSRDRDSESASSEKLQQRRCGSYRMRMQSTEKRLRKPDWTERSTSILRR